jgi:hypothetical protein
MASIFWKQKIIDSSVKYAEKALNQAQANHFYSSLIEASKLLIATL